MDVFCCETAGGTTGAARAVHTVHTLCFGFFVSFCLQSGRVTDLSVTIKKYVVYHPAWFHCCFLSVDGNERRKNNTLKSVSLVSLRLSHRFGFLKIFCYLIG